MLEVSEKHFIMSLHTEIKQLWSNIFESLQSWKILLSICGILINWKNLKYEQSSMERKLPYSVHCHVCRVYVGPLKELFTLLTERCGIFISSSHSFIATHTLSFIRKILIPQIHTIDTTHLLHKNISFSFFISEEHLERLD